MWGVGKKRQRRPGAHATHEHSRTRAPTDEPEEAERGSRNRRRRNTSISGRGREGEGNLAGSKLTRKGSPAWKTPCHAMQMRVAPPHQRTEVSARVLALAVYFFFYSHPLTAVHLWDSPSSFQLRGGHGYEKEGWIFFFSSDSEYEVQGPDVSRPCALLLHVRSFVLARNSARGSISPRFRRANLTNTGDSDVRE